MKKNKHAVGLNELRWKGKTKKERKAHSDMMNEALRRKRALLKNEELKDPIT